MQGRKETDINYAERLKYLLQNIYAESNNQKMSQIYRLANQLFWRLKWAGAPMKKLTIEEEIFIILRPNVGYVKRLLVMIYSKRFKIITI